jgi:hypothetical protein
MEFFDRMVTTAAVHDCASGWKKRTLLVTRER